jgi:hypothetical protein
MHMTEELRISPFDKTLTWICLPINLRNASSLQEPYWCAWEPGREADWIRPMPTHPSVISDPTRFLSIAIGWSSRNSFLNSTSGSQGMCLPPFWSASGPMKRSIAFWRSNAVPG